MWLAGRQLYYVALSYPAQTVTSFEHTAVIIRPQCDMTAVNITIIVLATVFQTF
jgi:hypothetical protein